MFPSKHIVLRNIWQIRVDLDMKEHYFFWQCILGDLMEFKSSFECGLVFSIRARFLISVKDYPDALRARFWFAFDWIIRITRVFLIYLPTNSQSGWSFAEGGDIEVCLVLYFLFVILSFWVISIHPFYYVSLIMCVAMDAFECNLEPPRTGFASHRRALWVEGAIYSSISLSVRRPDWTFISHFNLFWYMRTPQSFPIYVLIFVVARTVEWLW